MPRKGSWRPGSSWKTPSGALKVSGCACARERVRVRVRVRIVLPVLHVEGDPDVCFARFAR